ncbi:unnamed protein product [Orchesella dallaii]|uniref:Uncharacterized protein n=1 Tax=Orchesella dallaii TaxID=48710 RepID=A0ABP1Q2S4_9HEXA
MIFQPNLIVNVVEPTDRGRLITPYPFVTHYIGRNKYPLTTSKSSSVFQASFSGNQPFSGPVKKLTFLQLGSCEAPDMTPYTRTCKTVEFNGHISNTRTAFDIIRQLPEVTKVSFLIGQSQQPTYAESFVEFFSHTPPCPSVNRLSIFLDLHHFHSFSHDCSTAQCNGQCLSLIQYSLICLVESILKHAADSFPNLKDLVVELPEDDRLCHAVQMLIQICPGLRKKTQTSVQNIPSNDCLEAQEYSVTFNGSHQLPVPWTDHGSPRSEDEFAVSNQQGPMPIRPVNIHYEPPLSGMGSTSPSSGDQFVQPMYRPPPGFMPLPQSHAMSGSSLERDSPQSEIDVHQRVNSWLSSLDE